MNFRNIFGAPDSANPPAARSLGEMRPLHPVLRAVALLVVVALTLTGPVPQAALAATVYSLVTNAGPSISLGTLSAGTVVITPGTFNLVTVGTYALNMATRSGGVLAVQNLVLDGSYSVTFGGTTPKSSQTGIFTMLSTGTVGGSSVPTSSALEAGMTLLTSGTTVNSGNALYLTNIYSGSFNASQTLGGSTYALTTSASQSKSVMYTANKAGVMTGAALDLSGSIFNTVQDEDGNDISVLTGYAGLGAVLLQEGGSVRVGPGLNLLSTGSSGLILGGRSATLSIESSALSASQMGAGEKAVRVDSGTSLVSNLAVFVGSALSANGDILSSEVFLDPGAGINVTKTGPGLLRLGTLEGGFIQGGSSLFAGTINATGGVLQLGDSFLGVSSAATITNGTFAVTVPAARGFKVGMAVSGSGIVDGTTILAINVLTNDQQEDYTVLTLSKKTTGSGTSLKAGSLSSLNMSAGAGQTTTVGVSGNVSFSAINGDTSKAGTLVLGFAPTVGVAGSYLGTTNLKSYVTLDGTDDSSFSGTIVDALVAPGDSPYNYIGLIKRGTGSLALPSSLNTFSHGFTLEAGSLILSSSSSLDNDGYMVSGPVGVGLLSLAGGGVHIAGSAAVTLHNPIDLSLPSDQGTFSRTVRFSGDDGSSFSLLGDMRLLIPSESLVNYPSGSSAANPFAATLNLVTDVPVSLSGELSGSPDGASSHQTVLLVKRGRAALTLSGLASFSGDLEISEGTVVTGAAGLLSALASVTIKSGGALDLNGLDHVSASDAYAPLPLSIAGTGVDSGGALTNGKPDSVARLGADITLSAAASIGGAGDVLLLGTLKGGNFALTKGGSNTLFIAGSNTSSGPLTVLGGRLQVGHSEVNEGQTGGLGTGSIDLTSAESVLSFNRSNDYGVLSNVITGLGSVEVNSGAVTFSAENLYEGATTVLGGTLRLGSAKAFSKTSSVNVGVSLSDLSLTPEATLDLNGFAPSGLSTLSVYGTGVEGRGALVNNGANAVVYSGALVLFGATSIGGTGELNLAGNISLSESSNVSEGTLTITGPGTVVLTGASTQVAGFEISAGTLQLGNGGASGNLAGGTVGVNISTPGTLLVNRTGVLTLSNVLTGAGALKLQTGSLVLAGTSNAFSGSVTVQGGTLSAASGKLAAVGALNVSGGLLSVVDYKAAALLNVTGSGRATISGTGLSLSGAVSNANASSDSLLFSANSGTIGLTSLSGIGSTGFNSNASIAGGISAGAVRVAGLLTSSVSGGSVTAASLSSGVLSGGAVNVAGAATITTVSGGNVTIGGAAALTTVSGGVLNLNGSSSLGTWNGGTLNLGSASSLSIAGGASVGLVSGQGSLTKTGPGVLTLRAASDYTGTTTVSAGTLVFLGNGSLAGSVINNSLVRFENTSDRVYAGTFTGTGSLQQLGTSTATLNKASGYAGQVLISAGTLAVQGLLGVSSATIVNNATLSLFAKDYVISGTIAATMSGDGVTLLSGTDSTHRLELTLGTAGALTGTVKIGQYASLTLSSGATFDGILEVANGGTINFGAGFLSAAAKLTINLGGTVNLVGGSSATIAAVTLNGGTLKADGARATLYADTITNNQTTLTNTDVTPNTQLQVVEPGTLRLSSGKLVNYASGTLAASVTVGGTVVAVGTYATVEARASRLGAMKFDGPVKALNAVIASVAGGTVYSLAITAPVSAPFMDIQSGVTATFGTLGTYASGTLQIEGVVNLAGEDKSFENISLLGGTLSGEGTRATVGALTATSGRLAATLLGNGSITKTSSGVLTISGASPTYTGTLFVTQGTVTLGNAAALGDSGKVDLSSSGLLQLNGNSVRLSSLVGTGTIENANGTEASLYLNPTSDTSLQATLRNGSDISKLDLVKEGAQKLTVLTNQEYTGRTTIAAGSLVLNTGIHLYVGATSPTFMTLTGGTLDLGGNTQQFSNFELNGGRVLGGILQVSQAYSLTEGVIDAILGGAGSVTMSGASKNVTLNTISTYTGSTTVSSGTLSLGANGVLGTTGALFLSGAASVLDLGGRNQTVASLQMTEGSLRNGVLTANNFALDAGSVSAALSGGPSATLVKTGTGILNLSGANVLGGAVDIQGGSLLLSGAGVLSTGSLLVSGGAAVNLGNGQTVGLVTLIDGRLTGGSLISTAGYSLVSGTVSVALNGAVALNKTGASSTVFLNATNYYTGNTTLTAGTLSLGAANALGTGNLTVTDGVLSLGTSNQAVGVLSLNGGAIEGTAALTATAFNLSAGNVGAVLSGAALVTKTGDGTVTLSGANQLTGAMNIQEGNVTLAGAGRLSGGALTLATGAVVNLGGTTQAVGTVTLNGGTLSNGNLTGTLYDLRGGVVSAMLGGSADLHKTTNALLTLSGANTLNGTVVISGGTLALGNALALASAAVTVNGGNLAFAGTTAATLRSLIGAVDLTNTQGAGVALTLNSAVDGTYIEVLSGAGGLTKAGAGNLTLTGANTYAGATSVSGGVLTVEAGRLANTSGINVSGGSFNALDYNLSASLNVGAQGTATIRGSGLTFSGSLTNANPAANSVWFTNPSGTITLGSLYGAGTTRFAGNATLVSGGVSGGAVTVEGLLRSSVSGGSVNAGLLISDSVSGGTVTVNSVATLDTVSGGVLNLNGDTSSIATLNGGALVLKTGNLLTVNAGSSAGAISGGGALVKVGSGQRLALSGANTFSGATTVTDGTLATGAGSLDGTTGITVNGGSLDAVDYNRNASLNVGVSGTAVVRGSGLTFGGSLTNANSVAFTGSTGAITLGSLFGAGNTSFGSNAVIQSGGISDGVVTVVGSLNSAISGGVVTAGGLAAASISGGSVRVSGNASVGGLSSGALAVGRTAAFDTVSGGVLTLNGANSRIGTLTGGQITLGGAVASAVTLAVSAGASADLISGTGTLVKNGADLLALSTPLGTGVALRVEGGTLNSPNLLTGTRSVMVGNGGTLALTLNGGTSVYSGIMQPSLGSIFLTDVSGSGSTLQAAASSTVLDGKFTLGERVTLDLSRPESNIFGENATMSLYGGGALIVGGSLQEMEIQQISINPLGAGSVTFSGNGGKILYDVLPSFLNENNQVIASNVIVDNVSFDYLTKGGTVDVIGGSYKYTAGTVKDTQPGSPSLVAGTLTGTVLLLEPQFEKTKITIKKQSVNFTTEIIAGGTGEYGTISIGTLAYTPRLTIKTGVTTILDTPGRLQYGLEATSGASSIVNGGTLEVVNASGSKAIANAISGAGILTKTGAGLISLTGNNAQFRGTTNLNEGALLAGTTTALGGSTLNFKGGALAFGQGLGSVSVTGDVNIQAAAGAPVDTADNTVRFAGNLSGTEALRKSGTGTLVLEGNNSQYTGTFYANGGTLQVGDYAQGGTLSGVSNLVVDAGAILRLARAADTTLSQTISGAGTFEQAGTGTTVLAGDNEAFTGAASLDAGITALAHASALGSTDAAVAGAISFRGGTLQYRGGINTDYSDRFSGAPGQQFKIDTNGSNVTFAATLTGNATTLLKTGAGELVLSGVHNSYSGATTVQAGTLRLVGEQSGASDIALNGGRLVYEITSGTASGKVVTAANTSTVFSVDSGTPTFSGALSGAGSVLKEGAGQLTVTQTLSQTGGFTLNAGSLKLETPLGATSRISMGGSLTLNSGYLDISEAVLKLNSTLKGGSLSTLQLSAATAFIQSVDLDGLNLQIPVGTGTVTVFTTSDPVASTYNMVGGGTVRFKQFNAATLSADDLNGEVENPGNLNALTFNATSSVTFRNELTLSGAFKTVTGSVVSFSKDTTLAGAVQLDGGTVALTGGTLRATNSPVEIGRAGSPATLALSGAQTAVVAAKVQVSAGSITVANDAIQTALQGVSTLEVGTSNGVAADAQLVLGGGTGSMTLGAEQTLKGSGTIQGNITLADRSSTLSPGNSPGTLTMAGSVDFQNGTLQIEVGKTQQDQIIATGQTVSIGSQATLLIVDYENGALKSGAPLKDLFVGGTVTGNFSADRVVFMRNVGGSSLYSAMYTATGGVHALEINRRLFSATPGLSANAKGFAAALDTRIISQGASDERLLELGTGSSIAEAAARVPLQLASGSPAAYAEITGLSKQRTLTLNQGLANHFSSLRAGLVEAAEGEYNLWTTGYGTWHKQTADAAVGSAGFSGNTWGDMFGVEKRFGNLVVGVLGAAGSTSANFTALAGHVTTDSWHGGAYATAALGAYSLESGVLFGSTDSSARRTLSAPGMATQEGKIKMGGSEWLLHAGVARPVISTGSLTITPLVRLIAQGNTQERGTEKDLGGLEVTTQTQRTYSILHELGVEARQSLKLASKPASASLQLDWIHDYNSKGRALKMDIAGDATSRFGYKGSDDGEDALRLGAALETALNRRTTLRISLDYQKQSKAATTHGALSVGYTF